MNAFKEFAIENEITVEDINGSIWEKESTIDQKELIVEEDQIGK